jgi:hypothetical protein
MLSIINEIFEICKIRIELDFINKSKYFDKYEKLKNSLKKNFSEFIMNIVENQNHSIPEENIKTPIKSIQNSKSNKSESLDSFLLRKENSEILKYLSGRIYFNKFFEMSEIKNRYDTKKFSK